MNKLGLENIPMRKLRAPQMGATDLRGKLRERVGEQSRARCE